MSHQRKCKTILPQSREASKQSTAGHSDTKANREARLHAVEARGLLVLAVRATRNRGHLVLIVSINKGVSRTDFTLR